ncbi:MAG TPA: aldose 1-epimerase family protein [Nocardioidaceae bacterium]|nr:aldose 1-epimerase family protein [Nocardioidaceae bacterium]
MSLGGDEYVLSHGDYTAVVTEVGGGLRLFRQGDRDLILGYAADEVRPRYRGALLAPWPNRVVDGRYSFGGESYQLDLSEPERGHALHGLVAWSRFDLLDSDSSSAVLGHPIVPRTGYPFCVVVTVRYSLDDRGLSCSVTARNTGDRPAPYGVASHPYLLGGSGRVDDWVLELPASEVLEVTPDRLVPTGTRSVADTDFDYRSPRLVGRTELDHAFTSLSPDARGLVRARVLAQDGTGVECEWVAAELPWVQVHTADLPDASESRRGLALEPMSCPPDAFNSGTDLVVLEPGAEHTVDWTLRAVTP